MSGEVRDKAWLPDGHGLPLPRVPGDGARMMTADAPETHRTGPRSAEQPRSDQRDRP